MIRVYILFGPMLVCEMTEPIPLSRSLGIECDNVVDTVHSMLTVAPSARFGFTVD